MHAKINTLLYKLSSMQRRLLLYHFGAFLMPHYAFKKNSWESEMRQAFTFVFDEDTPRKAD